MAGLAARTAVGSGGASGANETHRPQTTLPDYTFNPRPAYPRAARRMRAQGLVVLRVAVSADGRAEEVTVFKSSGFRVLDDSARTAVHRWRFKPAIRDGRRVESAVEVPIRFVLESR